MARLMHSVPPENGSIVRLRWQAQLIAQHGDIQRFSGVARLGPGRADGCIDACEAVPDRLPRQERKVVVR